MCQKDYKWKKSELNVRKTRIGYRREKRQVGVDEKHDKWAASEKKGVDDCRWDKKWTIGVKELHSQTMIPEGKVALITGGAMGMGRGFADALLQAGAKVKCHIYLWVCWVYLLESPRRGDSNEYTQHAFHISIRKSP